MYIKLQFRTSQKPPQACVKTYYFFFFLAFPSRVTDAMYKNGDGNIATASSLISLCLSGISSPKHQIQALHLLIMLLPEANRDTLKVCSSHHALKRFLEMMWCTKLNNDFNAAVLKLFGPSWSKTIFECLPRYTILPKVLALSSNVCVCVKLMKPVAQAALICKDTHRLREDHAGLTSCVWCPYSHVLIQFNLCWKCRCTRDRFTLELKQQRQGHGFESQGTN